MKTPSLLCKVDNTRTHTATVVIDISLVSIIKTTFLHMRNFRNGIYCIKKVEI